jgi:hypothetical protein
VMALRRTCTQQENGRNVVDVHKPRSSKSKDAPLRLLSLLRVVTKTGGGEGGT